MEQKESSGLDIHTTALTPGTQADNHAAISCPVAHEPVSEELTAAQPISAEATTGQANTGEPLGDTSLEHNCTDIPAAENSDFEVTAVAEKAAGDLVPGKSIRDEPTVEDPIDNAEVLERLPTQERVENGHASYSSLADMLTDEILHTRCTRLGDEVMSQVWKYDDHIVIKRIEPASSAEVAAMRLVHEKTSIPVPQVLKFVSRPDDDMAIIFMEYIDGEPLDQAWESCTDTEKQNIVAQLRGYLEELRQVKGEFIGSVDRSVCNDQLFANRENEYGPYEDEDEFRAGMAKSLRACDANPAFTEVVIGFVEAMPKHDSIVLTHGDLVPRNVLVKEGNVVGIVDWEMAGFYPVYWEYVKGHFFADYEHPWMEEKVLDKIMTPFPVELVFY
ncbi:kinase-like domain-containing protein [Xylariaceae sp. AK1471]|nr:kinase-like domain-containing protein [Xylariaceae sp. AK1471]